MSGASGYSTSAAATTDDRITRGPANAEVLGVDIAGYLVEAGNRRAQRA
jgi:hypothetical protein